MAPISQDLEPPTNPERFTIKGAEHFGNLARHYRGNAMYAIARTSWLGHLHGEPLQGREIRGLREACHQERRRSLHTGRWTHAPNSYIPVGGPTHLIYVLSDDGYLEMHGHLPPPMVMPPYK